MIGKTVKLGSTWELVKFLTGSETTAAAIADINSDHADLGELFKDKLGDLSGCTIALHNGSWHLIFDDDTAYALALLACPDLEKQGLSFAKDFLTEER